MLQEATARDGWIRYLLNTRITVIIPIANADGFSHNRREEVGIDPNRDFAFDVAVRHQLNFTRLAPQPFVATLDFLSIETGSVAVLRDCITPCLRLFCTCTVHTAGEVHADDGRPRHQRSLS